MSNKPVVLITGGSSGFGHLVAQKLLAEGYIVYPAARRLSAMNDLKEAGAHPLKLDVRDDASVAAAVARIIAEQGRIDVLFNNAGYGNYGLIECVSIDDIQRQFDVNVLGYARMLKAVLPHMRQRRSGRILNTASVVSHLSTAGAGWYAASKHAVLAMTEALRVEMLEFGIDVIGIEPGAVSTGFQAVTYQAAEDADCPADYTSLKTRVLAFQKRAAKMAAGPESTANAVVKAIKAKKPKAFYRTTMDAKVVPVAKNLLGTTLIGNLIARQIRT